MAYINATEIKKQTGVSYDLIRKLTRQNYLKPINQNTPYLYEEDAIQLVLDYKANPKSLADSQNEKLEQFMGGVLSVLQNMEQRLNSQQPSQTSHASKQTGNQNTLTVDKKRKAEIEREMKAIQKWESPNKGMFNELNYYFSYKKYEKLLALYEELTGNQELRKDFDALDKELRGLVPEYNLLRQKGKDRSNMTEWTNYINGVVKPTKAKWTKLICTNLGLKTPTSSKVIYVTFQTPFELELGENLPF